jgi:hypothetical protein
VRVLYLDAMIRVTDLMWRRDLVELPATDTLPTATTIPENISGALGQIE